MTAATIANQLGGRKSGTGFMARCPAHKDSSPSLSVKDTDGRVLVHCFAGCDQSEVLAALRGLGLWPERERRRDWTPEDRERWAAERRELERDLPDARHWKRAAVSMAEAILDQLKAALFDPTQSQPEIGEIGLLTSMLARLEGLGDAALVEEYRAQCAASPGMAWAMVKSARAREREDLRALCAYLKLPASAMRTYQRAIGSAR
jgi:hypothetical protein